MRYFFKRHSLITGLALMSIYIWTIVDRRISHSPGKQVSTEQA